MMIEDRTRFEVLLEDIQTSVKLIAEGHGALDHRLGQMEARFGQMEARFDRMEARFDQMETRLGQVETRLGQMETRLERLETKVDGLEVFATDARRRLTRIEAHLELNGASSRPKGRADKTPKPRRKP